VGEGSTALGEVVGDGLTGSARGVGCGVGEGRARLGDSGSGRALLRDPRGPVATGFSTATRVSVAAGVSNESSSSSSTMVIITGGVCVGLTGADTLGRRGVELVPLGRPYPPARGRFGTTGGGIGEVEYRGALEGAGAGRVGPGVFVGMLGEGMGVSDLGDGAGWTVLEGTNW
jgi:hypothetical protein